MPHNIDRLRGNELKLSVDPLAKDDNEGLYYALCDYSNLGFIGLWTECHNPFSGSYRFLLWG